MSMALFMFWSSLAGVTYAYFGYPLLLKLVAIFVRRSERNLAAALPKVSLIVSVFNEEQVIEEKILNTLGLDYPRELLEMVFVSDGSNDRTEEIITRYADRGVQLRRYEGRIGKTACLNQAVPLASGEIIVFSDANSKYAPGVVRALVKHFADGRIGFVTGWTRYLSQEGGTVRESVGVYSRLENEIKRLESLVGSCVGADGAVFSIRKELYRPLQNADINDLVIPLRIVKQGYRGVLEEEAVCCEETAKGERQEFRRQVRITTRTIRAVVSHLSLLNPIRYGLFSFQFFSHKVCRLLVPFFLLVLFLTNMYVISESPVYLVSGVGQVVFYLMAAWGAVIRLGSVGWVIALSHTFGMVNLAILYAWVKYFKGETYVTWMPTQR